MKALITACAVLACFVGERNARAGENTLASAYARFQEGDYAAALKAVETPRADPKKEIGRLYLRAECHARLQQFAEALRDYAELRRFQTQHPVIALPVDVSYEEGQACYAVKDFDKARAHFLDSIHAGFRVGSSNYYVGFLSELTGYSAAALRHYGAILALPNDEEKLKQAALFRLAEISYAESGSEQPGGKRAYLAEKVLPSYQRAADFDPKSEIGAAATQRIGEVQAKLGEGAPRRLGALSLHFAQDLGWDSNVANIGDLSAFNISHKDAFFVRPSAFAQYQANPRGNWSLLPEAGADLTYYSQRNTPQIYQNDNADLTAALRNRYEHAVWQRPATVLLDLDYLLMMRDYRQAHHLSFYTRTYGLSVGEVFRPFATGPTEIKFRYQLYGSEDSDRSAIIPEISLIQTVRLARWDWYNSLSVDSVRARNEDYDERNYRYRTSIFFPDFVKNWNFAPSLAVSLKDTMAFRPSRGLEVNLNPSLDFSRTLAQHLGVHLIYGFTHYFSRDQASYVYTEHVLTTSLREDF